MFDFSFLDQIQLIPILIVLLGFGGGYLIKSWNRVKKPFVPPVYANVTRKEIEAGARFIPSSKWSQWRNPMKELRRYLGWPSGRQWVRRRKLYNKFFPGGAKAAAYMLTKATRKEAANA